MSEMKFEDIDLTKCEFDRNEFAVIVGMDETDLKSFVDHGGYFGITLAGEDPILKSDIITHGGIKLFIVNHAYELNRKLPKPQMSKLEETFNLAMSNRYNLTKIGAGTIQVQTNRYIKPLINKLTNFVNDDDLYGEDIKSLGDMLSDIDNLDIVLTSTRKYLEDKIKLMTEE